MLKPHQLRAVLSLNPAVVRSGAVEYCTLRCVWLWCVQVRGVNSVVFVSFLLLSTQIRHAWDDDKSVAKNLQEMGLSFDPNRSVPIQQTVSDVRSRNYPSPKHSRVSSRCRTSEMFWRFCLDPTGTSEMFWRFCLDPAVHIWSRRRRQSQTASLKSVIDPINFVLFYFFINVSAAGWSCLCCLILLTTHNSELCPFMLTCCCCCLPAAFRRKQRRQSTWTHRHQTLRSQKWVDVNFYK